RFDTDRSAKHRFRDFLHDREPDTRSLAGWLRRKPPIENPWEMLWDDALPAILDYEIHVVTDAVERDAYRTLLPGRGVHRVANQIREHLIQRPGVAEEVQRVHRRLPPQRDAVPARQRAFERDAGTDHGGYYEPSHAPRRTERTILDGAQIIRGLLDAFGHIGEIGEECRPQCSVKLGEGGATNRVHAEVEVSQRDREWIADFVRDHAGLAGQVPEGLGGCDPAPRPVLSGRNRAEGQAGKLEHQPGPAAAFHSGRPRGGRARAHRSDDPQSPSPSPLPEPTPHPAAFLYDRRPPATQGGFEIELDLAGLGIRDATEDWDGDGGRG